MQMEAFSSVNKIKYLTITRQVWPKWVRAKATLTGQGKVNLVPQAVKGRFAFASGTVEVTARPVYLTRTCPKLIRIYHILQDTRTQLLPEWRGYGNRLSLFGGEKNTASCIR
ncbi:hypothetical protein GCM10028818_13840 [Spirosoma horti]